MNQIKAQTHMLSINRVEFIKDLIKSEFKNQKWEATLPRKKSLANPLMLQA